MAPKTGSLTLDTVKGAYETLSGKASDIVRQLSLAAIGLAWLFKIGTPNAPAIEPTLLHACFFIFAALALDLLQYLVGTATWHIYFRYKEGKHTPAAATFSAPYWINWPTWILFWLKAASMVIAYAFILPFLYHRFVP